MQIKGLESKEAILFKNINYNENGNEIEIQNLKINNNKILNVDKIRFNYLTETDYKNQITLTRKNNNYELIGKSFDSIQLIENISNSEPGKNFFDIFNTSNSEVI